MSNTKFYVLLTLAVSPLIAATLWDLISPDTFDAVGAAMRAWIADLF